MTGSKWNPWEHIEAMGKYCNLEILSILSLDVFEHHLARVESVAADGSKFVFIRHFLKYKHYFMIATGWKIFRQI